MDDIARLCNLLADEARKISAQYFRQNAGIDIKADDTPVTIADRRIEEGLREIIRKNRPRDSIIGEEFGQEDGDSGLIWILDPIDGTKAFINGRPTFGTLIGLWEGDTPVAGVIDQPVSKERWYGRCGEDTTFNGTTVRTASCPDISRARFSSTDPSMFADEKGEKFLSFLQSKSAMTMWGGDCYQYGCLASGWVDIIVESQNRIYDYAALVPVVESAGGVMTDWQGNALTLSSQGDMLTCGDEKLHKMILEAFQVTL